jgi:hypothetical protein
MTSVHGHIRIGEGQPAMRSILARQRGSTLPFYGLTLALIIVGAVTGLAIQHLTIGPTQTMLGLFLGILAGVSAYVLVARRLVLSRFRKRLTDAGIVDDLPFNMAIAAEGLKYAIGGVRHEADWGSVTELFQSKGFWIFMVQSDPWFAPARSFANSEDERAFVRTALENMTEVAKSRSSEAIRFAG